MKLLHVDSSILGPASGSRRLSAGVVAEWRKQYPQVEVVSHDLAADPIPHLTGELLVAQGVDSSQHTPTVRHALALGTKALEEFLVADVVVVGAPMYNFGIPSQLKAWIEEKYLTAVFSFFGITDIRFLRAEGVNLSPEARQQAIAAAERDIAQLIAA